MMMEVFLSKEKGALHNFDIDRCYQILDDYFKERGVEKISQGVYKTDEFKHIATAQFDLLSSNWFLKVVDKWYCRYLSDDIEAREDALESYYRITARYADYK